MMNIYSVWLVNNEGYGYLFLAPKKPMLLCSLMLQIEAACPGATKREYDPASELHGYAWL